MNGHIPGLHTELGHADGISHRLSVHLQGGPAVGHTPRTLLMGLEASNSVFFSLFLFLFFTIAPLSSFIF